MTPCELMTSERPLISPVDKAKLYATLYIAAYPKKSKQVCQQEFNVKWTELKKDFA